MTSLDTVQLTLITPATPAELEVYWDDLELIHHFSPYKLTREQLMEALLSLLPNTTIIRANGITIGVFSMEVHRRSVELHAIIRPDVYQIIPKANRLKVYLGRLVLDNIFKVMNKAAVVIKGDSDNKGVRGFAIMHGFRRLPNTDKGRLVWVLKQQDYLSRYKTWV